MARVTNGTSLDFKNLGKGCFGAGLIPLVIIGIVGFSSAYHVVPPGFRGVKVTLGKVDPNYLPEGISFKIPFISNVQDVPVKQLTVEGKTDIFSSDLQNIKVSYNVFYRIPESKVVALTTQYSGEFYMSLVDPRLQERLKQITATYRAEDIAKKREEVKAKTLESIREAVDGLIEIVDVTITDISLGTQLEQAIEQKVIREQEALAKKFELEKAETEAEITIVEAKAEAEAVKIKGEALTSAPQVIDLEIARKWDGRTPQSVAVTKGGANILLPLSNPSPELNRQAPPAYFKAE